MPFLEPELGDLEALFIAAVVIVGLLWMAARTMGGQVVGTMRVTEWSRSGIQDYVAITVRRKLIGRHGVREARIILGPASRDVGRPRQSLVEMLTEEEAKEAAALLERAAAAAGG